MKTIIGWRFEAVCDNGDYAEWRREAHFESPIYTTKKAAVAAVGLCKKRLMMQAKQKSQKYISSQIDCEIAMQRSVNKFLCTAQKSLWREYAEIIRQMNAVRVVPVYAETAPTNDYFEYSVAL